MLTKDSEIFIWGFTGIDLPGIGITATSTPTLLPFKFDSKIIQLQSGKLLGPIPFFLALSELGTVYVWGVNYNNFWGSEGNSRNIISLPLSLTSFFNNTPIKQIAVNGRNIIAVSSKNDIYVCGDAEFTLDNNLFVPTHAPRLKNASSSRKIFNIAQVLKSC